MRSATGITAMALAASGVAAFSVSDLTGLPQLNPIVDIVKRQSNLASPYNGYQYVGCWSDASGARTLSNGPNAYNTIETCINFCASTSSGGPYNYVGLEYHHECYCGNTLLRGSSEQPESGCDAVCDGNPNELCGGGFLLSLYALANAVPTSTATALPTGTFVPPSGQKQAVMPGPYDYVGCYTDQVDGTTRALTGALAYAANTMSLETCANLCATYQPSLTYWGVEDGAQCFCGSGIAAPNHVVQESNCNVPCTGDNTENCGAANFINIYSDDQNAPYYSVDGGYVGQNSGNPGGNNGNSNGNSGGNGGGNPASASIASVNSVNSVSRASASSVASVSRLSASLSRASATSAQQASLASAASSRSAASASEASVRSAATASHLSAVSAQSAASVANSISRASASSAAAASLSSVASVRSAASVSASIASVSRQSSRSSASSSVSSARSSVSSARSSRSSALSSISSRLSSHSSLTNSRSAASVANANSKSLASASQQSSRSVALASLASAASSRSSVSSVVSASRASVASSRSSASSVASVSRASVLSSKSSVSASLSAAAAATTEVYRYVNCFNFNFNSPPLSLHPYVKPLTLQGCANKCYNHTYFGVVSGSQCYCGNTDTAAGNPIDISNCYSSTNAIACTGNSAEKCGANNAMPIFGQERYIGDCSQANYFSPNDPCRIVTGSKQGSTLARLPGASTSGEGRIGGTGARSLTIPTGRLNSTGAGLSGRPTGPRATTPGSGGGLGGGSGVSRLPGQSRVCVTRTAIINMRLNSTVSLYPAGWDFTTSTP